MNKETNLSVLATMLTLALPHSEMPRAAATAVKLWRLDQKLIELTQEEEDCGIEHTLEIELKYEEATMLLQSLGRPELQLHWNESLPRDNTGRVIGGRIRVVCKGPYWSEDRPLYLATSSEAAVKEPDFALV
jgi:hypothetical protein